MGDGDGESEGHDVLGETRENPSSSKWPAAWLAGVGPELTPD